MSRGGIRLSFKYSRVDLLNTNVTKGLMTIEFLRLMRCPAL